MSFTSGSCIENLRDAVSHGQFTLYIDGTYKLMNNRWVLTVVNVPCTRWCVTSKSVVQSPRPAVFMLTYSESEAATSCVIKSLQEIGRYWIFVIND